MIRVEGLTIELGGRRVVDGVGFELRRGETVGLVGESGSGKTLSALSILELLPAGARLTRGEFALDGARVSNRRAWRGRVAGMVFQEPLTALNPVYTIGDQLGEALELERVLPFRERRARVLRALAEVGLEARAADEYPHRLSGGMRQRAMIAMALIGAPPALIADEPTTALDPTVQAQVLSLLARLQRERGLAMLLVSHDLAVIGACARRVMVMYAGRVVEEGPVAEVLERPLHPYTAGLLAARPEHLAPRQPIPSIPGKIPSELPSGCRFRDRCARASAACEGEPPAVARGEQRAWCHHPC